VVEAGKHVFILLDSITRKQFQRLLMFVKKFPTNTEKLKGIPG
jgi:hypothetical protein